MGERESIAAAGRDFIAAIPADSGIGRRSVVGISGPARKAAAWRALRGGRFRRVLRGFADLGQANSSVGHHRRRERHLLPVRPLAYLPVRALTHDVADWIRRTETGTPHLRPCHMGSRILDTVRTVSGIAQGRFFEGLREDNEGDMGFVSVGSRVTFSPTWYMRGGPQLAASGVVTQQSAKVAQGLEAIERKGVVESRSPTRS